MLKSVDINKTTYYNTIFIIFQVLTSFNKKVDEKERNRSALHFYEAVFCLSSDDDVLKFPLRNVVHVIFVAKVVR